MTTRTSNLLIAALLFLSSFLLLLPGPIRLWYDRACLILAAQVISSVSIVVLSSASKYFRIGLLVVSGGMLALSLSVRTYVIPTSTGPSSKEVKQLEEMDRAIHEALMKEEGAKQKKSEESEPK